MSERLGRVDLRWHWIREYAKGGADASAMAKVFRNEKTPAPKLLAREAIQNSWDAIAGPANEFKMVFRFESYTGEEKEKVAAAFDLSGLSKYESETLRMDLPRVNSLVDLAEAKKPLRVLYVEDYGALGLRGPVSWQRDSDLYKAIYSLGNSDKNANARGGSFGFGKAAMFISSKIYCVAAYSAFAPKFANPHDATVRDQASRRLVAFVWWNGHTIGRDHFDGRAELLASADGEPHEDFVADQVALQMGMKLRDPGKPRERGTTFAIVDHSVDPERLISHIEESWWPAMDHRGLQVEVIVDGKNQTVDPRLRPSLQPYRKAYEIATGKREPEPNTWRWNANEPGEILAPFEGLQPGSIGVVRIAPEAQTADDEAIDAKIAQIRSSHMVIGIKELNSAQQLRGVYVAAENETTIEAPDERKPDENKWLRLTENAAHTEWNPQPLKEARDERPWLLAAEVRERIQRAVDYIRALFNQENAEDRVRSTLLAEYLDLIGDGAGVRRKVRKRKRGRFTIEEGRDDVKRDPQSPLEKIYVERQFTIELTKKRPTTESVRITGWCYIVEDGVESTRVPAQVVGEEGTKLEHIVRMTNASNLTFTVKSEPFDRRWSARLDLEAKVLSKKKDSGND